MTQTTDAALPKYFKDATGFCYVATNLLAAQAHLTPWNGGVDAAGFATETVVEKPARGGLKLSTKAAKPE